MRNSDIVFDLHMHSIFSIDGEYTCERLIEEAYKKGIQILSLTDHNCMKGIDECVYYAKKKHINIIPAIEFDSIFDHMETHILGYGIDYHSVELQELDSVINRLEFDAFDKKIKALQNVFHTKLDKESLLSRCLKENPFQVIYGTFLSTVDIVSHPELSPYIIGGSKFKNAVVDFYWDFCSYGKEAYVEVPYPNAKDVINTIHRHNGIAILAHPGVNFFQKDTVLDELLDVGIDGIEAFTTYHDVEQKEFFKNYALKHNIFITGGSDFHGTYKPSIHMGEFGMRNDEKSVVLPFLKAVQQ